MSYYAPALGMEPDISMQTTSTSSHSSGETPWWVPMIFVGVIGMIGVGIYFKYKLMSQIAAKEGSSGALKYAAGETALGIASSAADRALRSNPRKRGKRSKARQRTRR